MKFYESAVLIIGNGWYMLLFFGFGDKVTMIILRDVKINAACKDVIQFLALRACTSGEYLACRSRSRWHESTDCPVHIPDSHLGDIEYAYILIKTCGIDNYPELGEHTCQRDNDGCVLFINVGDKSGHGYFSVRTHNVIGGFQFPTYGFQSVCGYDRTTVGQITLVGNSVN